MPDKTAESCGAAFLDFAGPHNYMNALSTDGAGELIRAAKDATLIHSTSTPGRLERNGVAERAVRTVKEGVRTILLKSGLTE